MAIAKLPAATLVETLTAATILSLVASLGIMVFLRLSTPASNGAVLLEAEAKSYAMTPVGFFCLDKEENRITDTERLFFKSNWSDRSVNLRELLVTVEDNDGRVIYTRKRLYYAR